MNEQEIIQALKENLAQYGNLTEYFRLKMEQIGDENFEFLDGYGDWIPVTKGTGFDERDRFHLRPDYEQPEPEVVKCEYATKMVNEDYYVEGYMHGGQFVPLSHIPDGLIRIGFLYEGDSNATWASSRVYKSKDGAISPVTLTDELSDYEVLTPTHVLFRGKK